MAEIDLRVPAVGHRALTLLRQAQTELVALHHEAAPGHRRRALVVELGERLAALARHPDCPIAVAVLLHDWRDRLGSHVLVAEALAELEVHPDLALQLLRRGVDELADEAPDRLAATAVAARTASPPA